MVISYHNLRWFVVVIALLLPFTGCGGGGGDKQAEETGNEDSQQQAKSDSQAPPVPRTIGEVSTEQTKVEPPKISKDLPPNEVVSKFLTSLRTGDDALAAALLTDKARAETAKHDLKVQPPGSPSAEFRVGNTTVTPYGVNVESHWSESDGQGGRVQYELVCVLRKEPNGWRVAGLIPSTGTQTTYLNFEKPEEMMKEFDRSHRHNISQTASRSDLTIQGDEAKPSIRQASAPGSVKR